MRDLTEFMDLQLFAGEKTEPATPRHRQRVRQRGQVAVSRELTSALILLASGLAMTTFSGQALGQIGRLSEYALSEPFFAVDLTPAHLREIVPVTLSAYLKTASPIILIVMLTGALTQMVQVGLVFSGEPLMPKLERINPAEGLRRIFSRQSIVECAKALLKVTLIGFAAFDLLRKSWLKFPELISLSPLQSAQLLGDLARTMVLRIGLLLLCLAVLDYLYQRWQFEQSIKMSVQEVRDEYKEMEGDPAIRSKIRQMQRQMASRRMMQRIPEADVVITNPGHLAVALQYVPDKRNAPQVVAKGAGPLAERIKAIAKEHDIHIVENAPLAQGRYAAVEVGEEIPPTLYQAVAEVLALVFRLRRKRPE